MTAKPVFKQLMSAVLVLVLLAVNLPLAYERQADDPALPVKARSLHVHRPRPKPFAFPDGGRQLIPAYRFVALYGTPGNPALGALGDQPLADSIMRVQQLASQYQPLTAQHVMPTLEIIATIASETPTDNGDYSQEVPTAQLEPWVAAARQAGVYVVLDLQSGRSDFLTQAKEYEPLLKQPNVGLALDPEWRLTPTEVPLVQIGTVDITEVNQTLDWLAALTKHERLPQKLVVLHQFRLDMIQNRQALDTSHNNLALVIQMDGSGPQSTKLDTWRTITAGAPPDVHFGWKNFYHQDPALLDPAGTMAVQPQPWYVSYQ